MRFSHLQDQQTSTLHQNIPRDPVSNFSSGFQSIDDEMDSLIDLSDPSKALDLSRIRYQLMFVTPQSDTGRKSVRPVADTDPM